MITILKAIVGSHLYGLNNSTSDIDYMGIYKDTLNNVLTNNITDQLNINKDETYYEISRFLQLAQSANPTVIQLLWIPDKFIIESNADYEYLRQFKKEFLTKQCKNSFAGYAIQQIKKASGLQKKINWEDKKIERKIPLDFCYVLYENEYSIPFLQWSTKQYSNKDIGLASVNNFPGVYSMYHLPGAGGICDDNSNEVQVKSIPKNSKHLGYMYFNKDSYSIHCKEYREYQEWLAARNENRYITNKTHGQKYDGKNLMHCRRLLDTAIHIAKEGELLLDFSNNKHLRDIRNGDVNLSEIIDKANYDISELDSLFENSSLPETMDKTIVDEILLTIRLN